MKRIIWALLPFALLPARAQDPYAGLQVRGGLNFSGAEYDPDLPPETSKSSRTGFHAGALLDVSTNRRLHVLAGAEFDTRGYVLKTGNEESAFKADYLVVPFLLSFRPAPIVFLNAGGEAAFNVSATVRSDQGTRDVDHLENPYLGLRFEGGLLVPQGSRGTTLLLGAGYTLGLSQVFDNYDSEVFNQEVRHHVFRVFAGVSLGRLPL